MVNQENPRGIDEYHSLTKKIKDNPKNKIKLQKDCIVLIGPEMKSEDYVILITKISLEHLSILPIFYKENRDDPFALSELHKTALGMQGLQELVCYCPPENGLEESLGYITPSTENTFLDGKYHPYTGDFSMSSVNSGLGIFTLE